ncbi:MAG: DNA mismatch endonuclease Vsr [Gammaproteobacteria bacterium]|nr:DNA mismatch endonuclease Vsr [Gammaproteobacteria bacterium]
MTDVHSKKIRSKNMAAIKSKDTKPELIIRKALFAQGFRYKLHDKKLPGKPDLVFPKYHAIIFIHGCFWHRHNNCHLFKWPKSRTDFWKKKINRNVEVDTRTYKQLKKEGWYILTIWECALKGKNKLPFNRMVDDISNWLEFGTRDKVIKGK